MKTKTLLLACLLALAALAPARASAQAALVVGVDPALYAGAVAGARAWTDTGHVSFVVVAGCGRGDVNICHVPGGGGAYGWPVAVYYVGTPWIEVYLLDQWSPFAACHELGHYLGLFGHRDDNRSCMSIDQVHAPPYPDATDLAMLGS